MKQLVLLALGNSGATPDNTHWDAIVAHWDDAPSLPDGHISIPEMLRVNLARIRAEHMRWAYDMGYIVVKEKSIHDSLACGAEPSMWWTSILYERHPKLSPHLYPIYKLRCLELLLEREKVGRMAMYGGDERLRQVLKAFCAETGREFEAVNPPLENKKSGASFVARMYAATPAPLRAIARFGHWWWHIRRKLPFCGKTRQYPAGSGDEKRNLTATIATYFPNIDIPDAARGIFRSSYWKELHEALNDEARYERPDGPHFVRWLFIRFPSPQLDFAECLKLRDAFQREGKDGFSFHYLEEFLTTADLWHSARRWFALWLASARLEKDAAPKFHFKDSKINFWPYMKEEWRESFQGWRCLERCLQNMAFKRHAAMNGPQRWTLFPLENCPWERMLTLAARGVKNNGPVIGAQHSTIRPTDFRYFDDPRTFADPEWERMQPDIIGANGEAARRQWLDNGMPEGRLLQIEALRYLYLAQNRIGDRNAAWQNELPPEPGEPLEMPAGKKLLALTSFFADETRAHLQLLAQALNAGLFEGWGISIKPHPYLAVESWLKTLPPSRQEQITVVDGPLALALKQGITVWASNSTTAALEAALEHLNLIVMWPRDDFDLCPIQDAPGLLRTTSLADIRYALAHLRSPTLDKDYLDLNPALTRWKTLLGLQAGE